jgi:hypothetical protein
MGQELAAIWGMPTNTKFLGKFGGWLDDQGFEA